MKNVNIFEGVFEDEWGKGGGGRGGADTLMHAMYVQTTWDRKFCGGRFFSLFGENLRRSDFYHSNLFQS